MGEAGAAIWCIRAHVVPASGPARWGDRRAGGGGGRRVRHRSSPPFPRWAAPEGRAVAVAVAAGETRLAASLRSVVLDESRDWGRRFLLLVGPPRGSFCAGNDSPLHRTRVVQ
ncbi:hypothetical protein NL676_017196 [Syzygium grande]|nr:hypothetical protein NL676_017196 [Syzygium grande]